MPQLARTSEVGGESQLRGRESLAVLELVEILKSGLDSQDGREVELEVGAVCVPRLALEKMVELLTDVAEGRDVVVAPADLSIGTEEAARTLSVSQAWLRRMIDRGDMPSTRNNTKRRVRLADLVRYRREDDARRNADTDWSFLDEGE